MDKLYVQQYGRLESDHWWFIVRQRIILQILRKSITTGQTRKLKILNVGVAAGESSKWLSVLGDVVSLENDPLFLSYLSGQQLVVIDGSITDIPLDDDSFDIVCAFDVIEHVKDDKKAVEELVRVCKPGGSICITVPAFQSLWGNHDVVNGHQRRYKEKQLTDLVGKTPTTIRYSTYFNMVLFIPVFLFRRLQRLFKNNRQQHRSDFTYFKTNNFINTILKTLFGIEPYLLRSVSFPFGVSLLALFRKNGTSKNIA